MRFGCRILVFRIHAELLSCYALRAKWPAVAKALVPRPDIPVPPHTIFYIEAVLDYWLGADSATINWLGRSDVRAI